MAKKAIVLLSGGLDSSTCLAYAKHNSYDCYALSFDYGQRSIAELNAATTLAKDYNVIEHKVMNLTSLGGFGGSAITDHNMPLETNKHIDNIPTSYVPARNTVFIAIALSFAEAVGAEKIFIGVNKDDHNNYPDCRPEFIEKFQQLANIANRTGVEGSPIEIATPLLQLDKVAIISLGISLGIDYANTVTCYQASPSGAACGKCLSCVTRRNSFRKANIPDPTRYV